jgi:hypothetical protein
MSKKPSHCTEYFLSKITVLAGRDALKTVAMEESEEECTVVFAQIVTEPASGVGGDIAAPPPIHPLTH